MNPFIGLPSFTRDQAERLNIAALQFGVPWPVNVGPRRFTLAFEPCRPRYPLRLHGTASGAPLELDLDASALIPALAVQSIAQAGPLAHRLIADACEDWLCALEGAFGFALEISAVSYDATPHPDAYGLALTHLRSGRMASLSFRCEAVDLWLRARPPMRGPAIARAPDRRGRAGLHCRTDALVLARAPHPRRRRAGARAPHPLSARAATRRRATHPFENIRRSSRG